MVIVKKDYLNPKNFTQDHDKIKRVHDLINKMKRQIRINASSHNATIHYMNNYGYIPLWVLVKVLSFGIVCELFTILKKRGSNRSSGYLWYNTRSITRYINNFIKLS